jgi:hypothetical protein
VRSTCRSHTTANLDMQDILYALVWISTNILLAVASWRCSEKVFPFHTASARLMDFTVLFWAVIVLASTILGTLGFLYPYILTGLVLFIALVLLRFNFYAFSSCATTSLGREPWRKPDDAVTASNCRRIAFLKCRCTLDRWWCLVWICVVCIAVGRIIVSGLLRYPTDWDSLAYHVPLVDHWSNTGTLYVPACAFWYVPGNNELLGLWCAEGFSGDFWVSFANIPSVVLLAMATVELMKALNCGQSSTQVSGILVLFSYPVFRQLLDSENDVAVAGLWMSSIVYAFRYLRSPRLGYLIWVSMSLGLLLGTKYYALGYGGLAGATFVGLVCLAHGWRRSLVATLACTSAAFVWASYWYFRNVWFTGYPLFPKGLLSNNDLWSDMRPNSWTSTLLGSTNPEIWSLMVASIKAIGGPASLLGLCLLPICILWHLTKGTISVSKRRFDGILRLGLALFALEAGFLLAVTPNVVETAPGTLNMIRSQYHPFRFGLCLFSLLTPLMLFTCTDIARTIYKMAWGRFGGWHTFILLCGRLLGMAFCIFLFVVQVLWLRSIPRLRDPSGLVAVETALLAGVVGLLFVFARLVHAAVKGSWFFGSLLVVILACGLVSTHYRAQYWHSHFVDFYEKQFHVSTFSRLRKMARVGTIICVCDYRYYPFLGSAREYRVVRPLWVPTYEVLLDYVNRHDATIVIARRSNDVPTTRYSAVTDILESHPDVFSLMFSDDWYIVYAVHREQASRRND